MSDEQAPQEHEEHDGGDQDRPAAANAGQSPDDGPDPAADAADEPTDDEAAGEDADDPDGTRRIRATVEDNRMTPGTLVLHLEARDVRMPMDGDAALRLLKMFQMRDGQVLADRLSPFISSAEAGWFVLDLADVTAMSWIPGLSAAPPRTVVDPLPAQAA